MVATEGNSGNEVREVEGLREIVRSGKKLRIPSAVDRCTGRGQTDACEGTSWLYLACGRVDGD